MTLDVTEISNIDDLLKCELLERNWGFPQDFNLAFLPITKMEEMKKDT